MNMRALGIIALGLVIVALGAIVYFLGFHAHGRASIIRFSVFCVVVLGLSAWLARPSRKRR